MHPLADRTRGPCVDLPNALLLHERREVMQPGDLRLKICRPAEAADHNYAIVSQRRYHRSCVAPSRTPVRIQIGTVSGVERCELRGNLRSGARVVEKLGLGGSSETSSKLDQ